MNPLFALLLQGLFGLQSSNNLVSPEPIGGLQSKNIPLPRVQRMTFYLPTGSQTATGTIPKPNYTVAVSPDLLSTLPYGSLLKIAGQTYRVEDQTNPRLKSTIDIFHESTPSGIPGLQKNVPYQKIGEDLSGLRYKIGRR